NLMRPPSVELDFGECGAVELRESTPVRARVARIRGRGSAPGFSRRGHARAMDGIAPDGEINAACFFLQNALDQSQIGFFPDALLEGFAEFGVRSVIFRDQDDAGGSFVEAMHDSGPQRIAALGKFESATE